MNNIYTNPGFPVISNSFLAGQDIVYGQFVDVSFYIEDIEQENFYYVILKNLFADVRFDKIFPLGGKTNVLAEAAIYANDKKRVYIVDKDFDDLLSSVVDIPNLFYLEKYSIENYLIDEEAIRKYIIEEKPRIRKSTIDSNLNFNNLLEESYNLFKDLTMLYLTTQQLDLGIINVSQKPDKFCAYNPTSQIRQDQFSEYKNQVDLALKNFDANKNIDEEVTKNNVYFDEYFNSKDSLNNIPGKYIMSFIKRRIEFLFRLSKADSDSFIFRIAKNSSFDDLRFLYFQINQYLRES